MRKSCLIIGISGPTTSGKTTVSDILSDKLNCQVIHQDKYYHTSEYIYTTLNNNYQIPQAINESLIYQEIKAKIQTTQILIIQGFLIYSLQKVRDLIDVKLFLDINDDMIRQRRMATNPCKEKYFNEIILIETQRYRQVCKEMKDVCFIDGTLKLKDVVKKCLEQIGRKRKQIKNKQ